MEGHRTLERVPHHVGGCTFATCAGAIWTPVQTVNLGGLHVLNKEILNIDMDMSRRPIYDIEQDVWQAIADANGLDYEDIADGDLAEWL